MPSHATNRCSSGPFQRQPDPAALPTARTNAARDVDLCPADGRELFFDLPLRRE